MAGCWLAGFCFTSTASCRQIQDSRLCSKFTVEPFGDVSPAVRDYPGMNINFKLVKFNHFSACADICHGIFSRFGGCIRKPFDSLNIALSVGDEEKKVLKNRQIIIDALGGGLPVFINQVHGKKIFVLKNGKSGLPKDSIGFSCNGLKSDFIMPAGPEADGIVTDIPGVLLFIQVADCQPVMLYDPVKKVVANIHSGWKGSLKNIVGEGVDTMQREFGSDPASVLAGVGPSLGPCCSEFINYRSEIPEKFMGYRRGKNHFDFWQMTVDQLTAKGIKKENIELCRICTRCSHDSFFSYRHEKITGRFASVIKKL